MVGKEGKGLLLKRITTKKVEKVKAKKSKKAQNDKVKKAISSSSHARAWVLVGTFALAPSLSTTITGPSSSTQTTQ